MKYYIFLWSFPFQINLSLESLFMPLKSEEISTSHNQVRSHFGCVVNTCIIREGEGIKDRENKHGACEHGIWVASCMGWWVFSWRKLQLLKCKCKNKITRRRKKKSNIKICLHFNDYSSNSVDLMMKLRVCTNADLRPME